MMDDVSRPHPHLDGALEDIRWVNRWLGGHAAMQAALAPLVDRRRSSESASLRVLDLGTGAADHPEQLVRWGDGQGLDVSVVAVDLNPWSVEYARDALERRLPAYLRARIRVEEGDGLNLPFEDGSFDVALASMFMHHLDEEGAIRLLQEMRRVASEGLVINDLHRHPVAYYGIKTLAQIKPGASPMVAHDGPLSVLRGYQRNELRALAERAGLEGYRVRWHWAFRWILTTIGD